MAKKPAAKKRKGGASTKEAAEGRSLGTVLIPVQCSVNVPDVSHFNELVIEWSCLGLSEEPDSINEISGNARLLDPKHPPTTSEEGLHVFFDPPLQAGSYGFQFTFSYIDAVEARTADPEKVKELEDKREEHDRETAREAAEA